MNRLKVEHYRALTISRAFYDLSLKLDRRRLLVHVARLKSQGGGKRKEASISSTVLFKRNFLVAAARIKNQS